MLEFHCRFGSFRHFVAFLMLKGAWVRHRGKPLDITSDIVLGRIVFSKSWKFGFKHPSLLAALDKLMR